jgi:hypothetical protein
MELLARILGGSSDPLIRAHLPHPHGFRSYLVCCGELGMKNRFDFNKWFKKQYGKLPFSIARRNALYENAKEAQMAAELLMMEYKEQERLAMIYQAALYGRNSAKS